MARHFDLSDQKHVKLQIKYSYTVQCIVKTLKDQYFKQYPVGLSAKFKMPAKIIIAHGVKPSQNNDHDDETILRSAIILDNFG